MRVFSLLIWLAIVAAVLLPLLRRRPPAGATELPITDDLVKDPVCQTYVVRSRAVRRLSGGEPRYFCSTQCAQRYAR